MQDGRQAPELCRWLNTFKDLSENECLRIRVEKCWQVSPTKQALQLAHENLYTTSVRSPSGTTFSTLTRFLILKEVKPGLISIGLHNWLASLHIDLRCDWEVHSVSDLCFSSIDWCLNMFRNVFVDKVLREEILM